MAKLFSAEDETWIRENYPQKSWEEILERFPGKTKPQLISKAHCLGVQRENVSCSFYSEEEDNIIREKYRGVPIDELIEKWLPGRTKGSVITRASILGVHKQGCWTEEEDKIITDNYYDMPMKELCKLLPYRAKSAIHFRIRQLGLRGAAMYKYSDEDITFVKDNYEQMNDEELAKHLHRAPKSIKQLRSKRGFLHPDSNPKNRAYKSYDDYARMYNTEWREKSAEKCGNKCFFTGEKYDVIHHLYSHNSIMMKTEQEMGIQRKDNINHRTLEHKKEFLSVYQRVQAKYPLGICMKEKYHKEFHAIYGSGDNTPEQFIDYVTTLYPDKVDDLMRIFN